MQGGRPTFQVNPFVILFKTQTCCSHLSGLLSSSTSCVNIIRKHTTLSLSSAIRSHLSSGQPEKALTHFLEWQKEGLVPDKFTIPSLLKLSLQLAEPSHHGEHMHALAIKAGYIYDLFICTGVVDMYFSYGDYDAARRFFIEIPEKDVVLFTAMICGFAQSGLGGEAFSFFSKMLEERMEPNGMTISGVISACSQLRNLGLGRNLHGFALRSGLLDKEDVILETALLDMYAKCGNLYYAKRVFDNMTKRNLVSYHAIINAYYSNEFFEIALSLFKDMVLEGWRHPRSSTLASVLSICGVTTDLRKGKEIHGYVLRCINNSSELESLVVYNSIVDMYVKTGNIELAITLFESMPKRNVVTWTIMIAGYGAHGFSEKALCTFTEMKEWGVRPDGITFLSLLSACSHGGLVDEGRELYYSMQRDYNIVPEMMHFVSMVDLYGRAGLLEEAHDFIMTMPVEPSKFIWGALLSSCRNHKNIELGMYAAERALNLDPFDVGNYVLLSRLYAGAGLWNDLAEVRSVMKGLGLRPETACSWVQVKGKVYRFTVGDRLKVFSKEIYDFLKSLGLMMEEVGFVHDTSSVGHNINEEEKMTDLCGHTEKLALAFMLMKCRNERLIRIGKNLRICGDCHETFKFVSTIYSTEIILKDPNRYHRFAQGCCSCHDFW